MNIINSSPRRARKCTLATITERAMELHRSAQSPVELEGAVAVGIRQIPVPHVRSCSGDGIIEERVKRGSLQFNTAATKSKSVVSFISIKKPQSREIIDGVVQPVAMNASGVCFKYLG